MKYLFLIGVIAVSAWLWYPAATPTPSAPGHRMSADNVYFLLDYVSQKTPRGIAAFAPGQQVLRAESYSGPFVQGKLAVTDGITTMYLDRSLLTHDIDLAEDLAKQDSQTQAGMTAARLAETQRQQAAQVAASVVAAKDVQLASQRRMIANGVGGGTRLDDAATRVRGGAGGSIVGPPVYNYGPQPTPSGNRSTGTRY